MPLLRLSELPQNLLAVITHVLDITPADPISSRLRDVGFIHGEAVRLTAKGPLGGTPLLVVIGNTRFALRHHEAERVVVYQDASHD